MDEKNDIEMPLYPDNPDNVSENDGQDQNSLDLLISTTFKRDDTTFIDSFDKLKGDCLNKSQCVNNIYQRWIKLYMDSGFDDKKKTKFEDISFSISNKGFCEFCSNNNCEPEKSDSKGKKGKPKKKEIK